MAGLLNIGEMGALALHVLAELAALKQADADARMTAQEIAEKLHASVHTLQKVTRRLIMEGLVEGTRGANGGLQLGADADSINLLRIVETVEGKAQGHGCLFNKKVCSPGAPCAFGRLTRDLENSVRTYLSETTLADLRDATVGADIVA
ncbi:MAG: Rrf2 family transcriptional regulator [Planctomycetes bacterium]|nr:Rrf2 family transcriptional regulator [Planctomycetota bacterium]